MSKSSRKTSSKSLILNRKNHALFFNRELSWLKFNARVLEESTRKDNPLLERLKFLAIYESNMVEFFMIRVSGLKQVEASRVQEIQMDGKTPKETLLEISNIMHHHEKAMYRSLGDVQAGLEQNGIVLLSSYLDLNKKEKKYAYDYFKRDVFRVLTPMAIDPGHPFPHIVNNSFYLAVTLQGKGKKAPDRYAILESPSVLPRFLQLPSGRSSKSQIRLIPSEEIIKMFASELFSGTKVKSIHGFKIIRNNDIAIDEVASDNLLSTIEAELRNRRWGEAVALFYRAGMPDSIKSFLRDHLDLEDHELYERKGLLNLHDLWQLYGSIHAKSELKDKPFLPRNALPMDHAKSYFALIRKKNHLFHHPYDSFQSVVDWLHYAAHDPKVLAIKQTLYRTGKDSPIVRSLIEAAENGKQVTAVVELKARFDEERNITWAREMEKHGIHVIYGLVGMKIHAKLLQIIRREEGKVRSYCHLGTGNYNPATAKLYTDIGMFTADPDINNDVTNLFHSLTGYSTLLKFKKIAAAPINLREKIVSLIRREIRNAKAGKAAQIMFKMNSLVDADMILELYRASRAGVRIRLNIRGICCLKPGITGLSENISVISVVGRFLEHSRIFYFENAGAPQIYLSSADLMPRNLNRRIEVLFPVEDKDHVKQLIWILEATFRDNHNARRLLSDGNYIRVKPAKNEHRFSSQRYFREESLRLAMLQEKDRETNRKRLFQPVMNPDLQNRDQTELETEAASNTDQS